MPQAVRFQGYGDIDVLEVVEVPRPVPGAGQVLVEVRAAAINPGEAAIRGGAFAERWPSTFPSGQGSDLAGVVEEVGPGVPGVAAGDEVIAFTDDRASQAELVLVEAATSRRARRACRGRWPVPCSWRGRTAYAAVRAVSLQPGDTLVVSAAAGGVGSIVVQLARNAGATVIGLAGEANHDWLAGHGVVPVAYGDGVADRIRAASDGRVDAFIDTFGHGYVDLAIELGVAPVRIDTIVDPPAVARHGVKADGNAAAGTAEVVAELAALVEKGALEVPIAKVYPLSEVRAAYGELERRHTRGKIVLRP